MASIVRISCLVNPMFEPEHTELARVLQNGLRKHFKEATVEWVDCPDLTQEPFSLAAPGLCGDAVLLEIGRISDLKCVSQTHKKYNFKAILRKIYNNHHSFIIGAGFDVHESTQQFGELVMNASFSQIMENYSVVNQSRLGFWNQSTRKFIYEPINDVNPVCYVHGNFFICRGESGKVLRVYAKRSRTRLQFPVALHHVLDEKYSSNSNSLSFTHIIGLGGIFLTKYTDANNYSMHSCIDQLRTSENINYWLHHDNSNSSAAVGTIIINNNHYSNHFSLSGQNNYGLTEFHFKSFSLDRNLNAHIMESGDKSEFLGYFHLAKSFHRLDP